jgi:hypothetical protein
MILQSDNPIRMVRELKGAPLSILMVLSLVHQRVTQEYLERATGYTDKPVSQALAYMQEIGLADHTNVGWQLVEEMVKQLPLPLSLDEEIPTDHQNDENVNRSRIEEQRADPTDKKNAGRNISDSLTTTTLSNKDLIDSVVVDSSNNARNRNNSDFEGNLEEFKRLGVGKNKRTEALARMKHINPEYIRAHLKGLKKKDSKGLAIMRMEQGEDAPERSIDDLTPEERRAKYAEWEQ